MNRLQLNHLSHLISSGLIVILFGGYFIFSLFSFTHVIGVDEVQRRTVEEILPEYENEEILGSFDVINQLINPNGDSTHMDSVSQNYLSGLKNGSFEMYINSVQQDSVKRLDSVREQVQGEVQKTQIGNFIIALVLLVLLATIRGWSRIKSGLKKLTEEQITRFGLKDEAEGLEVYRGSRNFAYRFIKKILVLGPSYFLSRKDLATANFILNHEKAHLRYYDAIVRNLMVNLSSPIGYIIFAFAGFTAYMHLVYLSIHLMPEGVSFSGLIFKSDASIYAILEEFNVPPVSGTESVYILLFVLQAILVGLKFILIMGILMYCVKKILKWFSLLKEYLADEYAYLKGDAFFPTIKLDRSPFHPSGEERRAFVNAEKVKLSLYVVFLAILAIINTEGSYQILFYGYIPLVLLGLVLLLALDIYKLKMHFITTRQTILLVMIMLLFCFLEYLSMAMILGIDESNTSYALIHLRTIIYNILFIMILFVWLFLVRKRKEAK